MVRAVAEFSDRCEAPELTPECPFFDVTNKGDPVCAEQCLDLIAKHPEDLRPPAQVGLGGGLAATERRTRRGPSPEQNAYDAGQAYIEDLGRPIADWRFGSLLRHSRNLAVQPNEVWEAGPSPAHLLDEIARRGVDGEQVLPRALASDRLHAIYIAFHFDSSGDGEDLMGGFTGRVAEWKTVLAEFDGDAESESAGGLMSKSASDAVIGWASNGPAISLLSDVVPTIEDLRAGAGVNQDDDLRAEADWLIDRFTCTYLSEWRPTSMRREWRFIRAQRVGCAPAGLMRERQVKPEELAAALADDACDQQETQSGWTGTHLKTAAVAKLKVGLDRAASSFLRVVAELEPDKADHKNDLGFCLLKSEPEESLSLLTEALSAGTSNEMLTQLNLALNFHLLGDVAASEVWLHDALSAEVGDGAFVWRIEDATLNFDWRDNLLLYGEELLHHFSGCEGRCISPELPARKGGLAS